MVHEGIFATKAECDAKAGSSVDASGWTEANINAWCAQAESYINLFCQYNFSDNYDSLDGDVKKILTEAESNLVGIYGVTYNMNSYTTRIEAEDVVNLLWTRFNQCMDLLKDERFVNWLKNQTT